MPIQIALKLFILLLSLGVVSTQAQNWTAVGNQAFDAGHFREAAAAFEKALAAFDASGAPPRETMPLQITLSSAYMGAGEYREAERVLQRIQNIELRPTDELTRVSQLNAWGALHVIQGKLQDAESEFQAALKILSHRATREKLGAIVRNNLAALEVLTGQYAEGLNHAREALTLWEELAGPDSPNLIRGWAISASAQFLSGQHQDAQHSLERAISIAQKAYGPTNPLVGDLLKSDAFVLERLKRKKEAKIARQQARRILGPDRPAGPEALTWNVKTALVPNGSVVLQAK
jgi:tetratricopeptide (TPR) repeat protein